MASGSAECRDARGLLGDDAGVVDPDHGPRLQMQTGSRRMPPIPQRRPRAVRHQKDVVATLPLQVTSDQAPAKKN